MKTETVKDIIGDLSLFAMQMKQEGTFKLSGDTLAYFIQEYVDRFNEALVQPDTPYLKETIITTTRKFNPNYGMDRNCVCGHPYHRHFDGYEDNAPVGCKYCECYTFIEDVD